MFRCKYQKSHLETVLGLKETVMAKQRNKNTKPNKQKKELRIIYVALMVETMRYIRWSKKFKGSVIDLKRKIMQGLFLHPLTFIYLLSENILNICCMLNTELSPIHTKMIRKRSPSFKRKTK